eukprot:COSAG04_NODE_1667_length_6004_cov_3.397290_5_plen_129_part_00
MNVCVNDEEVKSHFIASNSVGELPSQRPHPAEPRACANELGLGTLRLHNPRAERGFAPACRQKLRLMKMELAGCRRVSRCGAEAGQRSADLDSRPQHISRVSVSSQQCLHSTHRQMTRCCTVALIVQP